MSEQRYIIGSSEGWLNVKSEPGGMVIALPEYRQVEFQKNADGRDYFTASEGVQSGKNFSAKQGNLGARHHATYRPGVRLVFNMGKQELIYPGGVVKAVTFLDKPTPLGMHPILAYWHS